MRRALAILALSVLPACGGSSNSPAAPPPPPTTQPPPPNYSGSYVGPMLYNVQGLAELRVTGATTVNHSGDVISFTNLTIVASGTSITFPLGTATRSSGDEFRGTTSYTSSGCGTVSVQTVTRFGGRQMNLTVEQASSRASCAPSRAVGELSR